MLALRIWWEDFFTQDESSEQWWLQLKKAYQKRGISVLRTTGYMNNWHVIQKSKYTLQQYDVHLVFFLKQGDSLYIEEREYPYQFYEQDGRVVDHKQQKKLEN